MDKIIIKDCYVDNSHSVPDLQARIRELESVLSDIASRTDWTRDDCGRVANAVIWLRDRSATTAFDAPVDPKS